jgi:hypothetical protein
LDSQKVYFLVFIFYGKRVLSDSPRMKFMLTPQRIMSQSGYGELILLSTGVILPLAKIKEEKSRTAVQLPKALVTGAIDRSFPKPQYPKLSQAVAVSLNILQVGKHTEHTHPACHVM